MGARIEGAGTPTIRVEGVDSPRTAPGTRVIPDRIETGTFVAACAIAGGDDRDPRLPSRRTCGR